MRILPYLLVIAAAAALIGVIIMITTRKGIEDRGQNVVELDHTSAPDETDQMEQTNRKISELVQRYLIAKHDADVETLEKIVETEGSFDKKSLEMEAQYVEEFRNIQCYSVPGIAEHTYIVYVDYEQKYIGIDTPVPSMNRFYICENSGGELYINMLKQEGEVAAYMDEVAGWPDIRNLINNVNTRFAEACDSDKQLRDFVSWLSNPSANKPETGSKAEEMPEAGTEAANKPETESKAEEESGEIV